VQNGAVVEVKGVQQLDQLEKIIEYEMHRQHGLRIISQKLREKNIDIEKIGDRVEDVTDVLVNKSTSRIVKKILEAGGHVKAIRVPGFADMLGYEPYNDIRLGKELGKLVKFYDIDGVFHSDELPNYGITEEEVAAVKQRLQMNDRDAFVMLGGPRDKVKFASDAIIQRLKAAAKGVPAETRGATPDGKTVFLRPRPGGARMYPETDILPIAISGSMLASLADKVPKHWDEIVNALAKKYNINKKLANQIFDSDYLTVFEEIASDTKIEPTFIAAKLTEDLTSLQRQGLDASLLTDQMIKDIFTRLDKGSITKESVVLIFEKLMKNEPTIGKVVNEQLGVREDIKTKIINAAIEAIGASSISDEELSKGLDRIINNNMTIIKEKGMNALSTLMGRAMAEYRGKANCQKVNSMLKDKISKMVNN
jgi:glutamyl-tRNA(Gln) amidotransferase subunit E